MLKIEFVSGFVVEQESGNVRRREFRINGVRFVPRSCQTRPICGDFPHLFEHELSAQLSAYLSRAMEAPQDISESEFSRIVRRVVRRTGGLVPTYLLPVLPEGWQENTASDLAEIQAEKELNHQMYAYPFGFGIEKISEARHALCVAESQ